jgi:hypothetical protein
MNGWDKYEEVVLTTTAGEPYTYGQAAELAYLIFVRFGNDMQAAHEAWNRMLQSETPREQFQTLVNDGEFPLP